MPPPDILCGYLLYAGGGGVAGGRVDGVVDLLGQHADVGQDEHLDHVGAQLLQSVSDVGTLETLWWEAFS